MDNTQEYREQVTNLLSDISYKLDRITEALIDIIPSKDISEKKEKEFGELHKDC